MYVHYRFTRSNPIYGNHPKLKHIQKDQKTPQNSGGCAQNGSPIGPMEVPLSP